MEFALPIAIGILLIGFVASEARYQSARRVGNETRYPVTFALRLILRIGAPLLGLGFIRSVWLALGTGEWIVTAVLGVAVIIAVVGDPGELVVTKDGVSLVRHYGIQRRMIPWAGMSARYTVEAREVFVVGKSGGHVTHTQYHVGQEQFLYELEQRHVSIT